MNHGPLLPLDLLEEARLRHHLGAARRSHERRQGAHLGENQIGAGSGSYGSMPPPMPGQGQDKKDKDANKPVKLWATIELTRG